MEPHFAALAANPQYRAPAVLPGVGGLGAALDIGPWRFRKEITVTNAGVQQLELGLDVLAHAQANLADVRLLRSGRQVAYLLSPTSMTRSVVPQVVLTNDPKQPDLGLWELDVPDTYLPLTRLVCQAVDPVFERDFTLWEEREDDRGAKYRYNLGQARWTQTAVQQDRRFFLTLADRRPRGGCSLKRITATTRRFR